jgi:hypothetical protein
MESTIQLRRQRVRKKAMMDELDVSQTVFQKMMVSGMPYTRFKGLVWFEPDKVHAWLDKFNRVGAPGVRRLKGTSVPKEAGK